MCYRSVMERMNLFVTHFSGRIIMMKYKFAIDSVLRLPNHCRIGFGLRFFAQI